MGQIRYRWLQLAQRVLLVLPPIILIASCGTFTLGNVRPPAFHLRHMSAFCSSARPGRPSFIIGTTFHCHVRSDGVALIN